jgi:putative FmdB family regulatory protein
MPEYTFKCPTCSKIDKDTRTFEDAGKEFLCKSCNAPMNKVYSIGVVKFNGGGFYSNDK